MAHVKYSKTCLKRPLNKKTKNVFQDQLSLKAGQNYCRMLQESILQYFRPSLSYHLSLRPFLCLFLSGPIRQGLLYILISGVGETWSFLYMCLDLSAISHFHICKWVTTNCNNIAKSRSSLFTRKEMHLLLSNFSTKLTAKRQNRLWPLWST